MVEKCRKELTECFREQIQCWSLLCNGPGEQLPQEGRHPPGNEQICEFRQRSGNPAKYFVASYALQQDAISARSYVRFVVSVLVQIDSGPRRAGEDLRIENGMPVFLENQGNVMTLAASLLLDRFKERRFIPVRI